MPSAGRAVAASIDGTLVDLTNADAYARIDTGAVVTTYSHGTNGGIGPWSGVQDCNNYEPAPPGSLSADFVVTPDQQRAIRFRREKAFGLRLGSARRRPAW